VKRGGGLAVIPGGNDMKRDYYNTAEAKKVLPGEFVKVVESEDGSVWNFAEESIYQHPFMQPFKDWKDYDLIKQPRSAFSFWQVEPDKLGEVVVHYVSDPKEKTGKYPALLERRFDKGRAKVLLFTTPMEPLTPNWNNYISNLNSFYVVLAGQTTRYLAG